jgi:hypothetical protein
MRIPTKKEIEQIRKMENRGAWNLPFEYLRKALPCDGCGHKPIVNPYWIIRDNPNFGGNKKYILGCSSGWWGGCEAYETLEEAIDNWNWHVEKGGHNCVI